MGKPFKFDLGADVKDNVTGFAGRILARSQYLTGCIQYGICPPLDKDGKMQDWQWLDESRLEKTISKKAVGGPMPHAPQG